MSFDRVVGHDCVLMVAAAATSGMTFTVVDGIDDAVAEADEMPVTTVITRGDDFEQSVPTGGRKRDLSFTLKPTSDNGAGLAIIKTAYAARTPIVVQVLNGPAVFPTKYDQFTMVVTKCALSQPRADVLTWSVEMKKAKFPGLSDIFDGTYDD